MSGQNKSSDKTTKSKKKCFVIGPIGDPGTNERVKADWLLKAVIRPILNELDYDVKRADEIPEPGMIDSQVINNTLDWDLVIADLTGKNPNAFYELGIRHMSEKPIIHMAEEGETLPFDVKPFRTIIYSLREFDGCERAKKELKEQVQAIHVEGFEVENPITRARGRLKLRQTATGESKLLLGDVEEIKYRLDRLEENHRRRGRRSVSLLDIAELDDNSTIFILHDGSPETINSITSEIERIYNNNSRGFVGQYKIFHHTKNKIDIFFPRKLPMDLIEGIKMRLSNIQGVTEVF